MTLVGMALRELWISFRLLLVLGALLLAAMPVAVLPHVMSPDLAGAPPDPLTWAAVCVALAETLAAAVAAAALAGERGRGTAGWLATRAVPRPSVALSWYAAFAILLVAGLVPVGLVVWLALEPFLTGPGPLVAATAATACAGLAALAAGILVGSVLPRAAATAGAAAAAAAFLIPPALGATGWWWLPADGLRVFGSLDTAARPVAEALRGGGAALGLAAVLLVAAVMVFERADL